MTRTKCKSILKLSGWKSMDNNLFRKNKDTIHFYGLVDSVHAKLHSIAVNESMTFIELLRILANDKTTI